MEHIADDPTEQVNLASMHPEKARELLRLLIAHRNETGPPAWPSLIEGAIAIDRPLGVPDRPDEEYVYWAN